MDSWQEARRMTDAECVAFLQWALPRLGLRWPGFRKVRRQVCKRLARRMRDLGIGDLVTYRAQLDADPREWAELDAMCRITISRFYRDKGVFRVLAEAILPELAHRAGEEGRDVTCWSAGCASGEEVYTLKMIWDERIGPTAPAVRLSVLGTDVDETLLTRALRACYNRGSLKEMPGDLIARCFDDREGELCVKEPHRSDVLFIAQDIRTSMPDGPFDLILCRNLVLTYFEAPLQQRVLADMAARLHPSGYLVIGAHEALPDGARGSTALPECRQILKYGPIDVSGHRARPIAGA